MDLYYHDILSISCKSGNGVLPFVHVIDSAVDAKILVDVAGKEIGLTVRTVKIGIRATTIVSRRPNIFYTAGRIWSYPEAMPNRSGCIIWFNRAESSGQHDWTICSP
jgi:hypothetical protein